MMKELSQNLLDVFTATLNHDFGSNIDADLATTESTAAVSNNLLIICVRKILASSLNLISLETLTKSFDHSILSFASAANPRSISVISI